MSKNEITIKTNNVPRYTIDAIELTPKERKEFDYIDWEAVDKGECFSSTFFRYKGTLYDLSEFAAFVNFLWDGHPFNKWDGIISDTFFSGILIKWVGPNYDSVIVGRYYC